MQTKAKIHGSKVIASGKYLALHQVEFTNTRGLHGVWECVNRTNATGAAVIIPRLMPADDLVLIRQFRPPAGRYMIEFPAGLIEPGETAEETAIRELYEETGYRGKIDKVIPPSYNSPGMSSETVTMVIMSIDSDQYSGIPENHQESSEDITTVVVSRKDLARFVEESIARGDGIDARIAVFAAML